MTVRRRGSVIVPVIIIVPVVVILPIVVVIIEWVEKFYKKRL